MVRKKYMKESCQKLGIARGYTRGSLTSLVEAVLVRPAGSYKILVTITEGKLNSIMLGQPNRVPIKFYLK